MGAKREGGPQNVEGTYDTIRAFGNMHRKSLKQKSLSRNLGVDGYGGINRDIAGWESLRGEKADYTFRRDNGRGKQITFDFITRN